MKKILLGAGSFLLTITVGCTNSSTDNATGNADTMLRPGDSSVTTTTVTTVTHHRYSGSFNPKPDTKYLDLVTRQHVVITVDSERGLVNKETDKPIFLIVEPTTHDTILGETGEVVNNNISKDESGNYNVDTLKTNHTEMKNNTQTETMAEEKGKLKIKTPNGKLKEKAK